MKKRILSAILAASMLFSLAACTSGSSGNSSSSTSSSAVSVSSAQEQGEQLSMVSMKTFEDKAGQYGTVKDMSGDYGYDAALVSTSDNINYIYMYLPSASMAESIITDSDGDGEKDSDIKLSQEGSNYSLYIQDSGTIYGQYLRVGSMITAVSGPASEKSAVKAAAESFFKDLGYEF